MYGFISLYREYILGRWINLQEILGIMFYFQGVIHNVWVYFPCYLHFLWITFLFPIPFINGRIIS